MNHGLGNLVITWILCSFIIYYSRTFRVIKLNLNRFLTSDNSNKNSTEPHLSKELQEAIRGLVLGDLYIRRRFVNASLKFKGSAKHEEYIRYLYSLFSPYCKSEPKIRPAKLGDKIHYSIGFDSLTNPLFNYYHELFYKDKMKIVPESIGSLLTARGLAFWAQDDGTPDRSGFVLQTNSFTKVEVETLIKTLNLNFGLNCSLHTRKETSRTKEA